MSRQDKTYVIGDYILVYSPDVKIETFSCESYHGIMFFNQKGCYQVLNNYHMGPRMIINEHDGYHQDLPFKPATFGFLPPEVQAFEYKDEGFINANFAR